LDDDALCLKIAEKKSKIKEALNLNIKDYYLATIHRAENTDNLKRFKSIINALIEISKEKKVVFPVHPRTKRILDSYFSSLLAHNSSLIIIDPVSYYDILILEKNAFKILTDSGGMQKEAYFLRVPCITLREETEWIETVQSKWNILVGADKDIIIEASKNNLTGTPLPFLIYGDGKTAEKIKGILSRVGL